MSKGIVRCSCGGCGHDRKCLHSENIPEETQEGIVLIVKLPWKLVEVYQLLRNDSFISRAYERAVHSLFTGTTEKHECWRSSEVLGSL